MNVSRPEPWSLLDRRQPPQQEAADAVREDQWRPAVDILERHDRRVQHVALPGVHPEEIEPSARADILTIDLRSDPRIEGERRFGQPPPQNGRQRRERRCRVIAVPGPKQRGVQPCRSSLRAA